VLHGTGDPVLHSFPAGQSRQRGEFAEEYYPAGQGAAVADESRSGHAEFAEHSMHAVALPVEYCP